MELTGQRLILNGCVDCGMCQKECDFLQEFGTPKAIASSVNPGAFETLKTAFFCSLCGLCAAMCPKKLEPQLFFLEMRQILVARAQNVLRPYKALRRFESIGKSRYFSFKLIPPGTNTIFFPGCSLSGTRPTTVHAAFNALQGQFPNCGMVLDCCSKPSHDLGERRLFEMRFYSLRDQLLAAQIKRVIVACPNCYRVFSQYGGPLTVKTIYEVLAEVLRKQGHNGAPFPRRTYTIHDPCSIRFHEGIHEAVRIILATRGIPVREMPHSAVKTYCCGEGGAVLYRNSKLSSKWTQKRLREAGGLPVITYCAGCANMLGREAETHHVLDLVLGMKPGMKKDVPVAPPFTYINRLLLKRRLQLQVK